MPQAYLKPFAAEGGKRPKIWRLGKSDGAKPEMKAIEKVAVRNHLYAPLGSDGRRDDPTEKKLGRLEKFLGEPIWNEVCHGQVDLTWRPMRQMLSLLVATSYVRTPAHFEWWKAVHRQLRDQFSRFDAPPSHVTLGQVRTELDHSDWSAFQIADEEEMKAAWNDYVASAGDIAPILLTMRYTMVVAERPVFVTSDNPVAVTHPSGRFKGLGDPDTEITFPISPTRILIMDNQTSEPNGGYHHLAKEDPSFTNRLTRRNAIEHMFSSRHPDAVLAELGAKF